MPLLAVPDPAPLLGGCGCGFEKFDGGGRVAARAAAPRVVVRCVNPLFGARTPRSIDEVSCVAVGKKESEGLGTAEWESTAPAGMAARQQTMVFSCRTKYFQ